MTHLVSPSPEAHLTSPHFFFTYYEQQLQREQKRKHISGYRFNERLKVKTDGSKYLVYAGFRGDLEYLTIEMRLMSESFECVMGECVI